MMYVMFMATLYLLFLLSTKFLSIMCELLHCNAKMIRNMGRLFGFEFVTPYLWWIKAIFWKVLFMVVKFIYLFITGCPCILLCVIVYMSCLGVRLTAIRGWITRHVGHGPQVRGVTNLFRYNLYNFFGI